jgi:hypothetical protein
MIFWSSWAGPGYFTRRRTTIDEGPPTYLKTMEVMTQNMEAMGQQG